MTAALLLLLACLVITLIAVLIFRPRPNRDAPSVVLSEADRADGSTRAEMGEAKGERGEEWVWRYHLSQLPPDQYRRYRDVIIPRINDDGTTEIDALIASRFGLFVIEIKTISGRIYGKESDRDWTIKNKAATYSRKNPIHQNRLHTRSAARFFDVPIEHVHSIVFFAGDSTFGKEMPANVLERDGLTTYICERRDEVLTVDALDAIDRTISQLESTTDPVGAKRRHKAFVLERFGHDED